MTGVNKTFPDLEAWLETEMDGVNCSLPCVPHDTGSENVAE